MGNRRSNSTPLRHSLSRRKALVAGAAGIGVAALGVAAVRGQDATPGATPVIDDEVAVLFVQAGFSSGTLAANADGSFLLSLLGAPEQTVYFSDRPNRIVGAMSTERFLGVLGFDPADPPNAALVIQIDAEHTDVIVFELTAPVYDAEATSLTYSATLLEEFDQLEETGVGFVEQPLTADTLPAEFGPSSLFIDSLTECTSWDPRC